MVIKKKKKINKAHVAKSVGNCGNTESKSVQPTINTEDL